MNNNFQTILVGIFLAFFVFAVLIFSGIFPVKGKNKETTLKGTVVVWGTFNKTDMQKVIENFEGTSSELRIDYVQKGEEAYQNELIEAFASDKGPDLFFITPDMIIKNQKLGSIFEIPFTSFPEKNFRDNYIDGAEIFISNGGIIGFPVLVDPLVVYYNKDILANYGISKVPEYWDELFNLNKTLTIKKDDGSISQSMIALGRFDNINNAKDILATLLSQSGNPIILLKEDNSFEAVFDNDFSNSKSPAEASLSFYTEFSNPTYGAYSWNRSLPDSRDYFVSGKSAFYLGRASELFKIQSMNPNLSFDVSPMFQARTGNKKTFGEISAVAINKKSTNLNLAFTIANLFASSNNTKNMSAAFSLPPVLRSLLNDKPVDSPYMYSFYNSAIFSRSWLDPNSSLTDNIFSELINNILSNKLVVGDAVSKAQSQFELLLK